MSASEARKTADTYNSRRQAIEERDIRDNISKAAERGIYTYVLSAGIQPDTKESLIKDGYKIVTGFDRDGPIVTIKW